MIDVFSSSGRTLKIVLLLIILSAVFFVVSTDPATVTKEGAATGRSGANYQQAVESKYQLQPQQQLGGGGLQTARRSRNDGGDGGGLGAMEGAFDVLANTAVGGVDETIVAKGGGSGVVEQRATAGAPSSNSENSELSLSKKVAVTLLLTTSKKTVDLTSTVDAAILMKFRVAEVMTLPPGLAWSQHMGSADQGGLGIRATILTSNTSFLSYSQRFDIHFIVLVTPEVDVKWIDQLKHGGWEVRVVHSPITAEEIQNKQIGREVVTDGAMGITEMVKIEGFKLKEFYRVVMVDVDILFHKNFEELFIKDYDLSWTHGGWDIEWLNGGFLVFSPQSPRADAHYDRLLALLKEGDFRPGSGWKGAGVGWTYGGRTIQGLLPYYFLVELPELNKGGMNHTSQTSIESIVNKKKNNVDQEDGEGVDLLPALISPTSREGLKIINSLRNRGSSRAKGGVHQRMLMPSNLPTDLELDRCQYNNMVQLDKCKKLKLAEVSSNHFTGDCQKPWHCHHRAHPLCSAFVEEWFATSRRFAATKAIAGGGRKSTPYNPCTGGKYNPLP